MKIHIFLMVVLGFSCLHAADSRLQGKPHSQSHSRSGSLGTIEQPERTIENQPEVIRREVLSGNCPKKTGKVCCAGAGILVYTMIAMGFW